MTLIDRAEHHLFQPLLYQCATGILSEGKIAAPLRELLRKHRNVEFVIAEVTGIDAGRAAGAGAGARWASQIELRLRLPHPGRRRAAVLLRARRVRPDARPG